MHKPLTFPFRGSYPTSASTGQAVKVESMFQSVPINQIWSLTLYKASLFKLQTSQGYREEDWPSRSSTPSAPSIYLQRIALHQSRIVFRARILPSLSVSTRWNTFWRGNSKCSSSILIRPNNAKDPNCKLNGQCIK